MPTEKNIYTLIFIHEKEILHISKEHTFKNSLCSMILKNGYET